MQKAQINELPDIIGNIGAEVITAGAQLACRYLGVADVVKQKRLHRVNVVAIAPVKFVPDHIEQSMMKALHQRQGFDINGTNIVEVVPAVVSRGVGPKSVHPVLSCPGRMRRLFPKGREQEFADEGQFKQQTVSVVYP